MRIDAATAIAVAVGLLACKDKPAAAPEKTEPVEPAPTAPPPSKVAKPEPPRPSLPTQAASPTGDIVSVEDAATHLPTIEGKEVLGLKQTSDKHQVHATWCIDGDGAEDVARKVGRMMAESGYTALAIRGDAKKAAVQGERDGYHMSMVVSASSAASCAAPQHYFASATIYKP